MKRLVQEIADSAAFALSKFELTEREREKEERYQQVYNNMAVGVARVSLDFRIEQANQAYCQLLGMTEEELIGKHLRDITMPETLEVNLKKQERLAKNEITSYRMEKVFRHRDGHPVYGILDANLIHDAQGNPSYFLGTVVDITERVRVEQALLRERERLELAADAAHFGVWDLDLMKDELIWDEWMYKIYGVEPDSFGGAYACWQSGVHPDDQERASREVEMALAGEKSFETEFRVVRPDGSIRYVKAYAAVSRDKAGHAVRLTGVNYDITERVQAQKELQQFEWLLEKENNGCSVGTDVYMPPYINVTNFNTERTILDAVGGELMNSMARDLMDLLDTSVAVYEVNGDYAFGLFASTWCRVFDAAGFKLCRTNDTKAALHCGKWLCHENCWNNSAKAAIESGRPTDIECVGGIHLYAEPIFVGDEVVGVINIGYGTPPQDENRLRELSEQFEMDLDEVRRVAAAYRPRPQYVIDVAKRHCHSVAQHIGEIVRRKRTQQELEERERRLADQKNMLELVINSAPINISWKDVNSVYTGCNKKFVESAGKEDQREIVGRTDYDLVWSGEAQKFLDDDQLVLSTGKTKLGYEENYTLPDGTVVWWRTSKLPLKDRNGEVVGLLAVSEDVTEQKQAEKELSDGEARFRSYVEAAPFGLFIADEAGHYLDANPMALKITGYTKDELQTMRVGDFHPKDVEEETHAAFLKLIEQGVLDVNLPAVRKDGERRLWNINALKLGADRYLGYVQDITQRQQLEEQLQQAQKLDAVGKLAGGVAHDFNNLLMGMMGYIELCQDEIDERHIVRPWLDVVMKEAKRSAEIVKQLLAFSRKQTIAPKVLDLNDVVQNMLKMLRHLIGENIDLLWSPGAGLCAVKLDPGQMDQVLVNLCINARDAINGTGRVTIETAFRELDEEYCRTHTGTVPGTFVMLAVSDDGCGMDEKTLENLFEPFFTTKPLGEGTGLGLSTVYGIVKQNEGTINVYSEPGKGSTFRIYLPCCATEAENELAGAENAEPSLSGTETILIVEDEESIRSMIARMLEKYGYKIITAASPLDALRLAAECGDTINLLITDVVMPEMNGRELAEKMMPDHPHMKILYMSGYTANVIAHRGVLEDNVEFLSKPFGRKQLSEKLQKLL